MSTTRDNDGVLRRSGGNGTPSKGGGQYAVDPKAAPAGLDLSLTGHNADRSELVTLLDAARYHGVAEFRLNETTYPDGKRQFDLIGVVTDDGFTLDFDEVDHDEVDAIASQLQSTLNHNKIAAQSLGSSNFASVREGELGATWSVSTSPGQGKYCECGNELDHDSDLNKRCVICWGQDNLPEVPGAGATKLPYGGQIYKDMMGNITHSYRDDFGDAGIPPNFPSLVQYRPDGTLMAREFHNGIGFDDRPILQDSPSGYPARTTYYNDGITPKQTFYQRAGKLHDGPRGEAAYIEYDRGGNIIESTNYHNGCKTTAQDQAERNSQLAKELWKDQNLYISEQDQALADKRWDELTSGEQWDNDAHKALVAVRFATWRKR